MQIFCIYISIVKYIQIFATLSTFYHFIFLKLFLQSKYYSKIIFKYITFLLILYTYNINTNANKIFAYIMDIVRYFFNI